MESKKSSEIPVTRGMLEKLEEKHVQRGHFENDMGTFFKT